MAKGIVIVGSFVGQGEDDLYVGIRRVASEGQRKARTDDHYWTAEWKDVLLPIMHTMNNFSRMAVACITATPRSAIR